MTEYEILRNAVQNLGAILIEEKLYPDSFDSALVISQPKMAQPFAWCGMAHKAVVISSP